MKWRDLRKVVPSARGGGGWGGPIIGDPVNWMQHYGIQLDPTIENERRWTAVDTSHVDRGVPEVPWGEDVLLAPCPFTPGKKRIETHMLLLGLDRFHGSMLTLKEWHAVHGRTNNMDVHSELYSKSPWCAETTASYRWYCMPILPPQFSMDVDYEAKVAALPSEYEVASAVEVVPMYMFLHRIEGPLGDRYSGPKSLRWCRDVVPGFQQPGVDPGERRVRLSVFCPTIMTEHVLHQSPLSNHYDQGIGVAASLKASS